MYCTQRGALLLLYIYIIAYGVPAASVGQGVTVDFVSLSNIIVYLYLYYSLWGPRRLCWARSDGRLR